MSEYYEIEIHLQSDNLVVDTSKEQDQDDATGGAPVAEADVQMQHDFTGVSYTTVPKVTIVPMTDWPIFMYKEATNDGAGNVSVFLEIGLAGSEPDIEYKIRISEA